MATEIKVPSLGESVAEAIVAKWLKQAGESVARDEPLVELETDKATLELPAPAAGMLAEILAPEGAEVPVGAVLGRIEEGAAGQAPKQSPSQAPTLALPSKRGRESKEIPLSPETQSKELLPRERGRVREAASSPVREAASPGPAARKLIGESGLDAAEISGTGPGGRITKADVAAALAHPVSQPAVVPAAPERETRVRMTRLRRRIAERLKAAQNNAAMLTTFNEIDMSETIALRERWREAFEKKHGVRLGFMSVFVKAAIVALQEFPGVNAEIDGDDIVYKNHYDIGVAVGAGQGLVVPVLRDADRMSWAQIEKSIAEFAAKARDGKLSIAELSGGTFTISNGGVYGSLLSTPILNPPQSGILGMHKIERRPVAVPGSSSGADVIGIRPMMYVALSYDHRIVDGREAVGFLVRVKECVENPTRLLLNL